MQDVSVPYRTNERSMSFFLDIQVEVRLRKSPKVQRCREALEAVAGPVNTRKLK